MNLMAIGTGTDAGRRVMRRLGGWGTEREAWIERVKEMIRVE